jgi:ribosomal subunit interface protein
MTLRVSGKNMDIGEVLRGQIAMRVEQAVKRYFDGGFGGHAVVERDGTAFRTHCSLHLDTGVDLQASATSHDPYASADISSERIEKRLRRYKRRLKERRPASAAAPVEATADDALASPAAD